MYNLHIYLRGIEVLHVMTCEWKYMNITNSCISCRKIRRCKTRVSCWSRKRRDETVVVLALSLHISTWSNFFLRSRKSAKYSSWQEFAIFIQCSHCMFVGYVNIMAKVSMPRVGTYWEEKEPWYRYWCLGYAWLFGGEKQYSLQISFSFWTFFPGPCADNDYALD